MFVRIALGVLLVSSAIAQPISAPELRRAKLNAISHRIDGDDVSSGWLVMLASSGLPLRYYEQLAQQIEAVSESDVQAAAKRYFTTGNVQIAVVGDASLADSLRALGIGEVTVRPD